jgi:ATP-binding cassette subfamily A (ABC1) protein 1
MDEADILGDRIAIIANGKLVCFGSSFSLKNKYGRGYYLTLIKKEISNESADVSSEIKNNSSLLNVPNDNASTSTESRMTEFDSLKSDSSIIENIDDNEDRKSLQNQTDVLKTLQNSQDIKIHKFIKNRIGNAVLFENIGNEMTYTISNKQQYTKDYEQFFRDIESNLETLGIDGITISDTTLEEIFVKLAKQPETIAKSRICNYCQCSNISWSCFSRMCQKRERIGLDSTNNSIASSNKKSDRVILHKKNSVNVSEDTLKKYAAYTKSRVSVYRWPLQQLYGLTIKRFHRLKRNVKGFIAEIVLPIIFVCLALLVSISVPPVLPRPPLEVHPWLYGNKDNYIYYSAGISSDNLKNISMDIFNITDTFYEKPSLGTRCTTNHTILVTSYTNNFRTNTVTENLLCLNSTYILPPLNKTNDLCLALESTNYTYTYVSPKCSCNSGFPKCPLGAGGDVEYNRSMSRLFTNDTLINLTGRNISDWLIKTELSDKYLKKRYGGFEFLDRYFPQKSVDNFYAALEKVVSFFSTNSTLKPSEILSTTGLITNKRVKVWYNNKGYYAHIGYLNTLNNAILRSKILTLNQSAKLEDYGIISVNHPMNYTNGDLVSLLTVQVFIDLFVAICIIFALSFIPASFLVFLVEERENHCKQLQFISGVKPYIYWISNFTWDLLNFCIPCLLCVIVFVAFDVKSYMAPENFPCMVALMLLYGWSCIPLMYPLNYIFQIPSSAFVLSSCLNVFVGVISTMTTTILEQLSNTEPDLYKINEIIKPIFICLFPHYCLGRGFIDMAIQYNYAVAQRTLGNKDYTFNPFKFDLVGRNLLALAVQGVVYFTINMLIEYKFFIRIKPAKVPKLELKATTNDEDVENERKRILEKIQENNKTKRRDEEQNGDYVKDNKRNNKKKKQPVLEVREDYIRLENLTKVYRRFKKCSFKKHVAVKSLCLGINKGECFGLIG